MPSVLVECGFMSNSSDREALITEKGRERIAMANELDMEHIKEVMRRSEQTLQTVSDIVEESVQANVAILSGNPAMA